jgi:hypothetical protein
VVEEFSDVVSVVVVEDISEFVAVVLEYITEVIAVVV